MEKIGDKEKGSDRAVAGGGMGSDRLLTMESLEPFDILTEFTSLPRLLLQKQEGGQGLKRN